MVPDKIQETSNKNRPLLVLAMMHALGEVKKTAPGSYPQYSRKVT